MAQNRRLDPLEDSSYANGHLFTQNLSLKQLSYFLNDCTFCLLIDFAILFFVLLESGELVNKSSNGWGF